MRNISKYFLLLLSVVSLSSCGEKADEEKYQKLEALRNSLTEHYDKLEIQNTVSEQYDSMKTVLDSMYARKDEYKAKIDSGFNDSFIQEISKM